MLLKTARSALVRLNDHGLQVDVPFSQVSLDEARELGTLVQEIKYSGKVSEFLRRLGEWVRLYVVAATECYIPLDILIKENYLMLKKAQAVDAELEQSAMKFDGREPCARLTLPLRGEELQFAIQAYNACGAGKFSEFSKPLEIPDS